MTYDEMRHCYTCEWFDYVGDKRQEGTCDYFMRNNVARKSPRGKECQRYKAAKRQRLPPVPPACLNSAVARGRHRLQEQMRMMYERGDSMEDIAAAIGRHMSTVVRWRRELGLPVRPRKRARHKK